MDTVRCWTMVQELPMLFSASSEEVMTVVAGPLISIVGCYLLSSTSILVIMPAHLAIAQARTSCHRCQRRKKRCDRSLPQCEACRSAHIACSFLEDDRQVGSYPITYVRGLEEKIQELEGKLAQVSHSLLPGSLEQTTQMSEVTYTNSTMGDMEPLEYIGSPMATELGPIPDQSIANPSNSGLLVDELKVLSLEATAERHLGSSSGLSFARLTQMVLRRLSPDKADFVFEKTHEAELQQPSGSRSPSDTLNSLLLGFNSSISSLPVLIGDFSLSEISAPESVLADLALPEEPHFNQLVDFYFAHSHTLYPIINRQNFTSTLKDFYSGSTESLAHCALWSFRTWMVLAIGSTTFCSVTLVEESESMLYYNKAMTYFEAALTFGDMAALEVLMLQVSYSFFNQLGPNTWFLVGLAARMATGMGLHTSSTYENLPSKICERRKRMFFSIYMMDRVVSMALGRPFALHDDDVDISPFSDIDDGDFDSNISNLQKSLQPSSMSVTLHILGLRRIASKISRMIFGKITHASSQTREEIIQSLHKELIDWRRSMPFPLPDLHPKVPHLSSNWYDFNFYTHLAMLYRPSPLFPTLNQERIKTLATAAAMSIREAVNMHRQRRFAYNWLNLLAIFTSTLSLIYAVTAQPDSLVDVLRETKAIEDLELVIGLLDTLSQKFSTAKKTRRMVEEIVNRYRDICRPE